MNVTKKKVISLTILTITAIFTIIIFNNRITIKGNTAYLTFKDSDKNINTELANQDALKIKEIFSNKMIYRDNPSCGFSKGISIRFDTIDFSVARDSCSIIKVGDSNKYFNITDQERALIEELFEKYGGYFPCI